MQNPRHVEIGICGLSCRLCPRFHTEGESRCGGCKSLERMAVGCPFITCAVKRKGIEFCWECAEAASCERWAGHRGFGRTRDTFTCYAALEDNIAMIRRAGVAAFAAGQRGRAKLLAGMLAEFNEGRSRTHFCIAAALLPMAELKAALAEARRTAAALDARGRSKALRALLDGAARQRGITLKLRK